MAVVEYQKASFPRVWERVEESPNGERTRIYSLRCENNTPVSIRLTGQHPQFPGGRKELIVPPSGAGTLELDMPASTPPGGSGFGYGYEEV